MSFSIGDVILVPIPFTDLTSKKVRPAVVIGHGRVGADVFVVPVSAQLQNADFPILDWRSAGLNVPCGVKAQLATIDARLAVKAVGALSGRDRLTLQNRLRAWLQI